MNPRSNVRAMALDIGDRRIGIAIADQLGLTVHDRPTLHRRSLQEDLRSIRTIVDTEGVTEVVVGYPRYVDGTPSRQTVKTDAFIQNLEAVLNVPVVRWDECLTSFAAEQHLEELGLRWRQRRKYVDALSAVLILEDYLSRRS